MARALGRGNLNWTRNETILALKNTLNKWLRAMPLASHPALSFLQRPPRGSIYYVLAFLIGMLALVPRLGSFQISQGSYFWAEDGNIFLYEAQLDGLASIFRPYAGYLHFYPRVIALISAYFEPIYWPWIMLAGWLIAYLIMIFSIASTARSFRLSTLSSFALISLVSLQPNVGENYFNLTNSQWMLGAVLILFSINNTKDIQKNSRLKGLLLFPLVLTGPFSLILSPILIIWAILMKDWRIRKYFYSIYTLGTIIQLIVLLRSDRLATSSAGYAQENWIASITHIFLGDNTFKTICLFSLFLFLPLCLIKKYSKNEIGLAPIFWLFAAFLLIISALYAHKDLAVISFRIGIRYTWIPYALFITSILCLSKRHKLVQIALIAAFSLFFFKKFRAVNLPNLQFPSFIKFSKAKQVVIPISPVWPTYPGWHIIYMRHDFPAMPDVLRIRPNNETFIGSSIIANNVDNEDGYRIESTGNDPILIFKQPIHCANATDIGVEVSMTRNTEGWTQLFWNKNQSFNEINSLRRWYPSGHVFAQFAFPYKSEFAYVRFDPMESSGIATIHEIRLYCLK